MRLPYLSICVFLWFGENALVHAEEQRPRADLQQSQSASGKQIFGSNFQFQLGEVEENPGWNPPKKLEGWGWQPPKGQPFGWQPVDGWGWNGGSAPQKGWTEVKEQKGWGWTQEPPHHHHHHPKGKGKKHRRPHRRPKKGRRRGKKKGHKKGRKGPPRLKYFPPGIKFIPPKIRIERPKILIRRPKIRFIKG